MKLTDDVDRFRELLFKKYDDQMGGLDDEGIKELLDLELKLKQNQKLRELVEKYYKHVDLTISSICKQMLEECKE